MENAPIGTEATPRGQGGGECSGWELDPPEKNFFFDCGLKFPIKVSTLFTPLVGMPLLNENKTGIGPVS